MKERKYFLGPARFPQWLLACVPFAKRFNDAAKKHDKGYAKGGTSKDKKKVDESFGKDMYNVCGYNPFAWACAVDYHLAVVILGCLFFNWMEKVNE